MRRTRKKAKTMATPTDTRSEQVLSAIIYLPNQSQRMTRQRWRVFILGIQQSRQQEGSRHDGQRFQMIPSNVAGRSGQRILDAFFLSSFA
jgi:hypothetical protein